MDGGLFVSSVSIIRFDGLWLLFVTMILLSRDRNKEHEFLYWECEM